MLKGFFIVCLLAIASGCEQHKIQITLPENISAEARAVINTGWPKVLSACPGLNRYAADLQFKQIDDHLHLFDHEADERHRALNGAEIDLVVADRPHAIPGGFRVNGHTCQYIIGTDTKTLRIQKSMCVSLCLDREYNGPTDYVIPL